MAEHDPGAFQDLFDTEPAQPSRQDVEEWVNLYTRLVELLERHLDETRSFRDGIPEPLQQYLSRENIKILSEELEIFKRRLDHWAGML